MGLKNEIYPGYQYYLTMTVVDWVDIFTRPHYRHIIVDALRYCQQYKGLQLHAWCLMSNHLHLIASAQEGINLSDILRDFKKFTSKRVVAAMSEINESRRKWMYNRFEYAGRYNPKIKNFKFWQDGNEAKEIHTNHFLEQKLAYIHRNPVAAEIVEEPEHYLYSSARDYAGRPGLLEVMLLV